MPTARKTRKREARAGRSRASILAWVTRELPVAPPPAPVPPPVPFTLRKFQRLVKEERWGEPDGPEIQIELAIKPEGRVVVAGRDVWGGQVPIPRWGRLHGIASLVARVGERYRFMIRWNGGAHWLVVQKLEESTDNPATQNSCREQREALPSRDDRRQTEPPSD